MTTSVGFSRPALPERAMKTSASSSKFAFRNELLQFQVVADHLVAHGQRLKRGGLRVQFQNPFGVASENFSGDFSGQIEAVKQLELRNFLARLQVVGSEQQPVLATDHELATKFAVTAERVCS